MLLLAGREIQLEKVEKISKEKYLQVLVIIVDPKSLSTQIA
jgi:hypothetical protein